tara:strand:- start:57 stop:836 length:780 start_codon:yes stop_codon:yes gene_type:complete
MAFKMKGSSLYGKLNLNRGGYENKPDGRPKSSAFQKTKDLDKKDDGTYKMPVSSEGVTPPRLRDIKGGKTKEENAERIAESKKRKQSSRKFYEENKALFTNEDGKPRKDKDGVFRTKDGKSISDLNQAGRTASYIRSLDRKVDGKMVKGYKTKKAEQKRDEANEKSGAPLFRRKAKGTKNPLPPLVRVKKKKKEDSPELIAFRKAAEERRKKAKQAEKDAKKAEKLKKKKKKKDRNWKVNIGNVSIGNASNPELQDDKS